MKSIALLAALALVLAGCKTKPMATPPTPKAAIASKPRLKEAQVMLAMSKPRAKAKPKATQPPQPNVVMLDYPPNAADYLWDILHSTNMVDWTIYEAAIIKPNDEPGLVACYNLKWPAAGLLEVPKRLPNEYFKMRGHIGPIGPFLPPSDPFPKLPFVAPWNPVDDPPGGPQ